MMFVKKMRLKGRDPFLTALVCCFCLAAAIGVLWPEDAQAIRLSMKRVIFEGPVRSDIITIMNNTPNEQTYRLGFRHYRMDENRALVAIEDEDLDKVTDIHWADDMIKYAPRRVTVPAGGSQQVRLLLRRPRDLPPGEYRSHLWIITEVEAQKFDAEPGKKAVHLTMQPAMTLPVFVRNGDLTATAKITDARLVAGSDGTTVSFVLHRDGTRSLYGDLNVVCTGGAQEFVASQIRGIAVYTEVAKRTFEYDVPVPPEHASDCRAVRIEYVADKEDTQYGGQLMASATASAG